MSTHPHSEPNGDAAASRRVRKRRHATPLDVEAKAIGDTYTALAPLKDDTAAIERVIEYVRRRFGFPG
jgi:hypothetical protein